VLILPSLIHNFQIGGMMVKVSLKKFHICLIHGGMMDLINH